jgi:rod shape-determining protein MreD
VATFVAFPILIGLMILQSAVVSRVPLLQGTPDLLLLAILGWALQRRAQTAWQWSVIGGLIYTLVSALPTGIALGGYAASTGLALAMRRRVWQLPILAMFIATFLGTLITQGLELAALKAIGNPIPVGQAINLVVLPGLFLNMLLAGPAYALLHELAEWIYPESLEV